MASNQDAFLGVRTTNRREGRAAEADNVGGKTLTPRPVPVVNFRDPTSRNQLNSAKPAACFGTNLGRQFYSVGRFQLRIWVESFLLSSSPDFFSSGLWGSFRSPRTRPPPDGSSFTHGMTSDGSLPQPVCQSSSCPRGGGRSALTLYLRACSTRVSTTRWRSLARVQQRAIKEQLYGVTLRTN